jgi:putative tricarboxylic transport membrane protein
VSQNPDMGTLASDGKMARVNVVAGLFLAAVSALLLWVTYLPQQESLSLSLDSMYWPRLVLWSLLVFSLVLSAERLWSRPVPDEPSDAAAAASGSFPVIALACCAVYFVLIGLTGFLLSTVLFCVTLPVLLGIRDWKRLAAFSLGVTGAVWLLVIVLMHVALPRGTGIFRDISLFLY